MKKNILALVLVSGLGVCGVLAEPLVLPPPLSVEVAPPPPPPAKQGPTRFDLDFPGGTPGELVEAIQKSSKKPLNAIIPSEYVRFQLPPLRMRAVTVPELFRALELASMKTVKYVTGTFYSAPGQRSEQYQQKVTSFGFRTDSRDEDAVWYFRVDALDSSPLPDVCRFYQLDGYLGAYKIEDITTAIKTGWSMLQVTNVPQLKFHPETKLLIAVGQSEKLSVIDEVLEQLKRSEAMQKPQAPPRPLTSRPHAPPAPKTEDDEAK